MFSLLHCHHAAAFVLVMSSSLSPSIAVSFSTYALLFVITSPCAFALSLPPPFTLRAAIVLQHCACVWQRYSKTDGIEGSNVEYVQGGRKVACP